MNEPAALMNPRYRLIAPLGQGSMGAVYRAQDRLSGQNVALKHVTLDADDVDELRLALAHEFRTLAGLRHPHIISVLDYGFTADRQPFFTMELLDNTEPILEAGRDLSVDARIDLLIQALEALAYLHRRGILHHDLKPANMLVADGRLHLLDFGLAVLAAQPRADDTFGTFQYLAPEVIAGQPYSEASDLYSLGVIAYELLVGRHPIAAQTARAFLQELRHTPPDLSPLAAQPALATVVGHLLAKAPAARPPSAQVTIRAFLQALGLPDTQPDTAIRESYLQAATFVGRAPELAQLSAALEQARQGQGAAFLIGGESGVGKSRLLDELRTRALVEGFHVLRGQAVEGGGLPYQLWREPLRHLALDLELSDLEAGVLLPLIPDLGQLLGRVVAAAPELSNAAEQQRLMFTIVDLYRRYAHPAVLILEDLQWAQESLAPLKELLRTAPELPLLVLGNYRDDEAPGLPQQLPSMQLLTLRRFSAAEMHALSRSMLGETADNTALANLFQRESEGNVFFLIEVVRALAEESGTLAQIGHMTLPAHVFAGGIQQIVQRRLAKMPAWGQPLLRAAALLGRQLDRRILTQLADSAVDLTAWLQAGLEAAIFDLADGSWRFAHDKLREVLAASLPDGARAPLHRALAEAIERAYPDEPAYAEALLEHWIQANEPEKIWHYTRMACELLVGISRFRDALALAARALAHAQAAHMPSATRLKLLNVCFQCEMQLSNYPTALAHFDTLVALAEPIGALEPLVEAYELRGVMETQWQSYAEAKRWYSSALQLARVLEQPKLIAGSLIGIGFTLSLLGDTEAARSMLEEALRLAVGDAELARRYLAGEAELSPEPHARPILQRALNALGVCALMQAEYTQAERYFAETLVINRALGDRRRVAVALHNLGYVAQLQCAYARAEAYLQEGLALNRMLGAGHAICDQLTDLSGLALAQANYDQARQFLAESLPLARALDVPLKVAKALSVLGLLHAVAGELPEALAAASAAAALLRAQPQEPEVQALLVLTQCDLVAAATALGQHAEAQAALGEALALALVRAEPDMLAGALVAYAHWQRAHGSVEAAAATIAPLRGHAGLEYTELRLVVAQGMLRLHLPAMPAGTSATRPAAADLAEAARAAQARLATWAGD